MSRLRYVSLMRVLVASVLTLVACGDDVAAPLPSTPPLTSAQVLQPGPYGVGVTTMTFEDTSRPTMPYGASSGSLTRVLVADIRYPAAPNPSEPLAEQRDAPVRRAGAPYPLIVQGHGCGGARDQHAYLQRHLASHGYVVVAPDFPATSGEGANCTDMDMSQQPEDVRFLVDQVLGLDGVPGGTFSGTISGERIGLTGYSSGALSNYVMAYHPVRRDSRVRVVAVMAGFAGCLLSAAYFDSVHVPLLMIHGTLDALVDYDDSRHVLKQANAPKYLVTLASGTHTGFVVDDPFYNSVKNVDQLTCRATSPQQRDFPAIAELLGGTEVGVAIHDCRPLCEFTTWSTAMRPSRQQQLTILSVPRSSMRTYAETSAPSSSWRLSSPPRIPMRPWISNADGS